MSKAEIVISGNSSGAVAAVNRLKNELGGLQSLAAKAISFSIAGLSAAKLVEMIKAVADTGDALNKMSQKTGIAVEDLSKLQYAADLSGVSAEALQKGLTSLAVNMVEAGAGSGIAAEQFKKLGISVRNADGSMKSSGVVLSELADKFQLMPDGVEKTNLAVAIFGKKLGAEMIPLLNLGAAGLKAMGDEAQNLGLVMNADLAKKSEEFNDNLQRLQKLSNAAGISIASKLVPALNDMLAAFINGQSAGLDLWDSMALALRDGSIEKNIERINAQLARLKKQKDDLAAGEITVFGTITDEAIAKQEKLLAVYKARLESETVAETLNAAKRVAISTQLQAKIADLAKLRSVAEGRYSAEILLDDDKRTALQIKNAQSLRDALATAWKQTVKEAEDAGKAAQRLFDQANTTRQTANDKATDIERSTLPPEDQQYQVMRDFRKTADDANFNATNAQFAATYGRIENATKLAAQASKDAERASKFADQITDPMTKASAVREAGEITANLQKAQGTAKLKEQKNLEDVATSQASQIADLDKQITELQTKAGAIKLEVDIAAATGAIATLQQQLDALDKTITVTVNTTGVPANADTTVPMQPGGGYARGGYTGPGGKWQPAGIVHAGEFVNRQEVVRQPGALAFLTRFNQIGMAALRRNGYANGGLVNNLHLPTIAPSAAAASSSSATFVIDGLGRFQTSVSPDVMNELKTAFAREALKKGGRR